MEQLSLSLQEISNGWWISRCYDGRTSFFNLKSNHYLAAQCECNLELCHLHGARVIGTWVPVSFKVPTVSPLWLKLKLSKRGAELKYSFVHQEFYNLTCITTWIDGKCILLYSKNFFRCAETYIISLALYYFTQQITISR